MYSRLELLMETDKEYSLIVCCTTSDWLVKSWSGTEMYLHKTITSVN